MATRKLLGSLLLIGLFSVGGAARAEASVITAGPDSTTSFDILWSKMVGTTELLAVGAFDVTVTDTFVDFLITVTNDTNLYNQRVHSIGFDTDPNGTGLTNTASGTYFKDFALNQKLPGFQKVDICAWSTQNCSGGGQQSNLPGLGGTDTFGFRLLGDFSDGIEISRFAIKFMGDLGSFEFEGHQPPPTQSVPEPAAMALMGLGALGLAARRRRSA